ncbi:pectate lyase [uncultured Alistipes sp.]|jgi:pectate lyase|uniref:fibronectin type III domain-containing protein n=1 Tax=uncultured Alistipes sp. TaxID=538949 RepID=UPI0025F923BC|nr:pectate lyase [uncultured Alistipes sp.]
MKRYMYSIFLGALLLMAACGGDSSDEKPSTTKLPVPAVTVSVSGLTATVRWSISEQIDGVRFTYEFYRDGAASPEKTDVTRMSSQNFDLEAGVSYKIRVKTTIPSGSVLYEDSAFSDYTPVSSNMLNTPVASLSEKTSSGATLTWAAVSGAVKYAYELYQGAATTVLKGGDATATTVVFDDLEASTAYRFRVKAVAGSGASDSTFSVEVAFETDKGAVIPNEQLGLPLANENDGLLRAFPGAEGGGMYTTGGRGGTVYHVTNLNDSGTGSLREAVGKTGARTIVFDVAGTIALKSELVIKNGNLTIAGQTAPGQGIAIKDNTVRVAADNVIIRYMRFRLGNESSNLSDGSDAIWGRYQKNIILDHCSMSWAIDECASFYANQNFTMQWCVISECLRVSGVHSKDTHGYGGIWGGKNASFHHNLLAHNDSRNARIDHPEIYGDYLSTHRGNVDYRNNVIYNWGNNSTYGGEDGHFNIVNNYYKPGPASKQRRYFLDAYAFYSGSNTQYAYPKLYMIGNYHAGDYASAINSDNWAGVYLHDSGSYGATGDMKVAELSIVDGTQACFTTTHPAADAYTRVVAYAGTSLSRDIVDERIARETTNATAEFPVGTTPTSVAQGSTSADGMIDSQSVVGGWPALSATTEQITRAATDSDGDGIPDYYEDLLGLDKNDKNDGAAKTLDPQGIYTNLEVYLHYLVKDITVQQVTGGTYARQN